MAVKLKKLRDQVIVITGASSGIGLATARMAAAKGARLVLAARSSNALRDLADEITRRGGAALHVTADVGRQDDVREIVRAAEDRFGGFDTWVNNAAVAIYGRLLEIPVDDMRRLFETNFWGVVYGSLEGARHLRRRGGALINIGSTLSDRALPLQGIYSASKHAVKGFTDALRMELEEERAPVSVTLIKPGAIDTPYTQHARNYMDSEAQHAPPVYAPETVARAILHAAEIPERDLFVGAGGKMVSAMGQYAPRITDRLMERFALRQQKSGRRVKREHEAFDRPSERLEERGGYEGHVAETSFYTQATLGPVLRGAAIVGAGLAAAALLRGAPAAQRPGNGSERFTKEERS
jgi:short-subunit dehydrogenase